jgi:hypothetical protein
MDIYMKNEISIYDGLNRYLFIGTVALIVIGAMIYSFYSSNQMINKYSPLVDATMEVKFEATTAHLWFEEIISGDRYENDIEDIMKYIDQANWYATAMLEGGQNQEGTFILLSDLALRKEVATVIEQLKKFKELTSERYNSIESSGIGSEIEQQYDRLFRNFIDQIDRVESLLQQKIKKDFSRYKLIQILLIIGSVILSILGFFIQYRYDREQKKNLFMINDAFERFKIVLNSLEAFVYVSDMDTYEILFLNNYGKKLLGNIKGQICWQNIQKGQTGPCDFCTNKYLLNAEGKPGDAYKWEFKNTVTGQWFHIVDRAIIWTDNRIVRLEIATDISDRKEEELVKEALIEKLEKALNEIKKLKGILPICSSCKMIRDDKGYWNQIESYIRDHSEAEFSHGICPDCAKKLYPDLVDDEGNLISEKTNNPS